MNIIKLSNDSNIELDNLLYENLSDQRNFDINISLKYNDSKKDYFKDIIDIIDNKL
jgi:hypothetical protein